MEKIAGLSEQRRRELFRGTAERRGWEPAVVEKDFWVCWVLKRLFEDPAYRDRLVFKGGTSLSKVHGLIERFSEDIDLVLDWRLLGYGPEQSDPFADFDSRTGQDKHNKEINRRAAEFLANTLLPDLEGVLHGPPGVIASLDPDDPYTVNVAYPASFDLTYLRPMIRLEIGPLASWIPSASHSIKPYSAMDYPEVFDDPVCPVVAIAAERTFWEKATILHQQAFRVSVMPAGYSRHYYDLERLSRSEVKGLALRDRSLLDDVVAFKRRFYPCSWARYEEAFPGSFRLIPDAEREGELKRDYRDMRTMFFAEPPPFDQILADLGALEMEINAMGSAERPA